MKASELKERTKNFAVVVMKLVDGLPKSLAGKTVAAPLVRCGTAVGATYRSACKSRNRFDFMARISTVEEAADECVYWCEIILDTAMLKPEQVQPILEEGKALRVIFTKSRRSAAKRLRNMGPTGGGWENDIPF